MTLAASMIENVLDLYLEGAPWVLFGLLMAGLIKAWVPDRAMHRWLGGRGLRSALTAALAGAPLPVCSCGVLPLAIGLRRAGASREATVSFMISTPETGVDSVAVSYALLGPFMAVARPVAAVASAVFTGMLTTLAPEAIGQAKKLAECACGCGPAPPAAPRVPGVRERTKAGIRYAFTEILDDITPWFALGLVLAGTVATFVPLGALSVWGEGLPAMVAMLVAGIPMYICATASTPLAAALLIAGVSPGAVMVFMLAGPATNVATLAVVRNELGLPVMVLYLAGICASSLVAGAVTDLLVSSLAIDIHSEMSAGDEIIPSWLAAAAGVVLAGAAVKGIAARLISTISKKATAS